jgi:hypothetical protein
MATKFLMTRDINGYNGFGLPFSDTNYQVVLQAASNKTLLVPLSPYPEFPHMMVVFSYDPGSRVWVANNTAATTPSTGAFAATQSQLLPGGRIVKSGDTLNFITDQPLVVVGVSFYVVY